MKAEAITSLNKCIIVDRLQPRNAFVRHQQFAAVAIKPLCCHELPIVERPRTGCAETVGIAALSGRWQVRSGMSASHPVLPHLHSGKHNPV